MCVCMHSRFVENHPIRILEDGPLISDVVLSQPTTTVWPPPSRRPPASPPAPLLMPLLCLEPALPPADLVISALPRLTVVSSSSLKLLSSPPLSCCPAQVQESSPPPPLPHIASIVLNAREEAAAPTIRIAPSSKKVQEICSYIFTTRYGL
jgi:hypothetical protein